VLRVSGDLFSAVDGSPVKAADFKRWDYLDTPRRTWGAETVASHDGSVVAEGSWLGTIWLYEAEPPPVDVVAETIARVRAGPPVQARDLVGRWKVTKALFKVYDAPDSPSTSDQTGIIGIGGFVFREDGVWLVGLGQFTGAWELREGRRLSTTDVRGQVMEYEVCVSGDRMEWISAVPPRDGDFRVDLAVTLERQDTGGR